MRLIGVFVLVFSLGIDTLLVAVALGAAGVVSKLRIAAVFTTAEACTPIVGLLVGYLFGYGLGHWASILGGALLMAVGLWQFVHEGDESEPRHASQLAGWTLLITAVSISLDEFAVGFSIGFLHIPVLLTMALIALQAFIVTWFGLKFGARLRPYFGEWVEKLPAVVLGLLGVWMLIDAFVRR
ncbi:Putative Mn2+ efflux pump MntP [Alicyclobacillus hesperidum]|uniref:Putative Mn2+ efflux pump MntP n=1 Tax=Alicyclobacillus hesperidum TaxID=89784 RepID=A0A1H2VP01_9BACL|nr:manganese efflux pump [Alicyclobacillus hesperidum]SDW70033.1 Putative Mn2+ efflux pump MntP [Alicyclobacillus hesperidum]